jgi:hypothetical protein
MIFNIQNLYNSLSEENKQKLKRTVGGAGSQVVREGIELSRLITKPEAEEVEETEKYLEALYSAYLGAENVERERRGDKEVTVIKEPESMGLQLTRDVLGFAGSMIGVGKLAKPLKGIEAIKKAEKAAPITSKVTQTVLTGEVAAQLSINPYEETLAGVVGSMLKDDDGLEGDIKKYLLDPLTSSQEKSELENRLALLGEGLVFTGAFAAAGKGLSLAKEPFLNTLNKIKSKGEDAVGDFLSRMSDYKQLDAKQKQVALQKRKKDIQDGKVADMGDIEALEAPKSTKWLSEVDLQFSQNDLLRNFSNFTNRLFNPRGGRTANMHEKFLKTENVKEKWNATISHIASNLDRTINEVITKTGANKEDLLNKINEVAFGSFGGIKNPEARQKIFDNALKNLPKEIQPLVVRMRETQDELSRMMTENDFLTKAQKEIYEDNLGSYVRNSYKLYSSPGYKPTKSVEKEAKAYLANQLRKDNPGMSENEVILQTDAQYKEIIGTRKDVSTFSSSLEKFDKVRKEIFQGRKEIPAPIKNLLGEIENPIDKFIFSASKLANAVEDLKFYDDIAQDGKNIYFYGDKTGVFSEQIPQGYGKLSGQYTTPQLKRYFSTVRKFGIDNEGEFGKIYRNLVLLKGISQSAKTVWSHATHIKNIAGGAQMSLANGTNVFNPKRLKETLKVLNAKTKPGELQEFYEELAGRGILNKGVVAGDLRGLVKDIEKMSPNNPMLGLLRNGVVEKAQKLYIAEDDFFKINMYLGEEQYLKRLNNALPDNLKMNDEAIKDEAAKMVRDVLPNYDLVPELLKDLRRTPVFGRFFSFMAESVRISVNSLSRGIKEVRRGQELLSQGNTKAGGIQMERGMRRLAAFTTVAGGGALALEKGSQALSGLSNEDIEAAKQFLADYTQNSKIFISVTPEGEPAIGNISSWDAFDFPKKPFQIIINKALSDKDYTEENIVKDILTTTTFEMVSPFLGESIIQEQLSNYVVRGGRDLDGKVMTNPYPIGPRKFEEKDNYIESITDLENLSILLANIVQGIEPGSVSSIRKYADTWDKEKTDFDEDIYPAQSFAKFITGFGVQPLNKEYMENVYSFKVKDLAKKKSSRRNSLYGAIGDELDPETFINNYLDVNKKYYREFAKLHKLTEAAEQFDLPVFELLKGTGFNKLDMTTFLGKKRNFMPLGLTEDLKLKMLESSGSMDAWFDVVQDIAEIDRQLSNLPVLIDKDINKVMEQEEEPEASELFKTLQEDTYDRLQKVKGGLVEGPDVPFTDENPADRVDPMTGQPYSAQTERVGFSIGGKVALQLSKVLTKEAPTEIKKGLPDKRPSAYHGSPTKFEEFADLKKRGAMEDGVGYYFTDVEDYAKTFAGDKPGLKNVYKTKLNVLDEELINPHKGLKVKAMLDRGYGSDNLMSKKETDKIIKAVKNVQKDLREKGFDDEANKLQEYLDSGNLYEVIQGYERLFTRDDFYNPISYIEKTPINLKYPLIQDALKEQGFKGLKIKKNYRVNPVGEDGIFKPQTTYVLFDKKDIQDLNRKEFGKIGSRASSDRDPAYMGLTEDDIIEETSFDEYYNNLGEQIPNAFVMRMSTKNYLKLTTGNKKDIDRIKKEVVEGYESGRKFGKFNPDKVDDRSQPIYLYINKYGKVTKHEGRHRAALIEAEGGNTVPVVIHLKEEPKTGVLNTPMSKIKKPKDLGIPSLKNQYDNDFNVSLSNEDVALVRRLNFNEDIDNAVSVANQPDRLKFAKGGMPITLYYMGESSTDKISSEEQMERLGLE